MRFFPSFRFSRVLLLLSCFFLSNCSGFKKSTGKVIELHLVQDYGTFLTLGENSTTTSRERLKNVAKHLDAIFRVDLETRIILRNIQLWTHKDYITINKTNSKGTLVDFMKFRGYQKSKASKNSVYVLITKTAFEKKGSTIDKAGIATICSPYHAAAIVTNSKSSTALAYSIAHEIGHIIGLHHDSNKRGSCRCNQGKDARCIMGDKHEEIYGEFSNCSIGDFKNITSRNAGFCLNGHQNANELCWNGIDCDEKCCDGNCNIKPAATPCRNQTRDCDLPEYCTGKSGHCPKDYHKSDSLLCNGTVAGSQQEKGRCLRGRCFTRDEQCKQVFGQQWKASSEFCYKKEISAADFSKMNMAKEDFYCGYLQCMKNTTNPSCDFLVADLNRITYNFIGTGSYCGNNGVCGIPRCTFPCITSPNLLKCMSLPDYQSNYNAFRKNCSGRGVHNNFGNCHCESGWAPPFCDVPGSGGSINSGPITWLDNPEEDNHEVGGLFFSVYIAVVMFMFVVMITIGLLTVKCVCRKFYQYGRKNSGRLLEKGGNAEETKEFLLSGDEYDD